MKRRQLRGGDQVDDLISQLRSYCPLPDGATPPARSVKEPEPVPVEEPAGPEESAPRAVQTELFEQSEADTAGYIEPGTEATGEVGDPSAADTTTDVPSATTDSPAAGDATGEMPRTAGPRAALAALRDQLDGYLAHIDSLESAHGQAVTVIEMCQRVSGTVAAVEARAMAEAFATADEQLPGEASPSGYRPHAAREADDDRGDRWVSRRQIAATGISAACRVNPRVAHGMLNKALRMTRSMPNALDRAQSGDWSGYQLAVLFRAADDLDDDALAAADEKLFAKAGYVTTDTLRRRLRTWAAKHTSVPPEPEADHEQGMHNRRVEFSETDLFGMRWLNGYLPAAVITAIENALAQYAAQVDKDDPRTADQVRADVFQSMLFGPAALAPAAAQQLGLSPVLTDPATGYPQIDPEQYTQVQDAWETIVMLMGVLGMSTPAPPRTLLTVSVPLATLLCLRAGIIPGATGAHAPPEGASGLDNRCSPGGARACSTTEQGVDGDDLSEYDREDRAYIEGLGFVPYQVLLFLLAGEPDLQRLVTDELTGMPLDLGAVVRHPNARMRRRVQLRDQTCRFPYCDRPAVSARGELDLDHTLEHRPDGAGGHTADANLACLCREHHRIRHHTAWRVEMRDDGAVMIWRNPGLGLELITRPGGITENPSHS
ncbi:DUF222 domain-containing protein [Epidermidibacterium keratini]|uniref:DUF222 domain-containing protein n=1 Tax=Epidermidibacterium keratini TaxID=1891644 RepID=A0A7L4YR68_9ACTN|nr:HNH endonuclease signature motif containing protein [Epidermidibacterium keratini]QHC01548.1 DUF222 domain-containing protein [Epidermidibacterium keratini]